MLKKKINYSINLKKLTKLDFILEKDKYFKANPGKILLLNSKN